MNTVVSFELAKLLKEKGFVCIESDKFWMNGFSHPKKDYNPITYQDKDNVATISDVVMWLYDKHGIWIEVSSWLNQPVDNEIWDIAFQWFINGLADGKPYKTPTKAYEGAIKYVLNSIL